MSLYLSKYPSPVGAITMVSDGHSLKGLWFDGQKYFMAGIGKDLVDDPGLELFRTVEKWLDSYFAGERPDPASLPLAPEGGEFRRRVWRLLLDIPYGETRSYGRLARLVEAETGRRMSAQALGGAVGHNPISIIIPCHRVLGADGSLTGYAGGIKKKLRLLELEGVDTSRLKVSTRYPDLL